MPGRITSCLCRLCKLPKGNGMEADYAYGAHFALRVLVLPVVPLREQEYARQLALLRQHSRIALADVPPTTTAGEPVSPLLAPTPASRGFLNLNFVETWNPELAYLNEYQVHRKVMGVVGLLDCAEWTGEGGDGDLQDGARAFREVLKRDAPTGIFASRCYAFNPRESQNDNAEGLVVIPNVGDLDFYINTLLAELASNMLAGISQILSGLDTKTSIQMPMGTSVASSSILYAPSATPGTPSLEQRMSLPGVPGVGTPVHERANSPFPPLPPSRPASVAPAPTSPTTPGEGSDAKARKKHPGRVAKLRGDLFCLAGKIQEAMTSYNEATIIARAHGDFAWQASAIEANIITQVYQSWLHTSPPQGVNATPRPSISGMSALQAAGPLPSVNNPGLVKELPARYAEALSLYIRTSAPYRAGGTTGTDGQTTPHASSVAPIDSDTVIHPLLFIESCMRFLRMQLLVFLRADLWDGMTVGILVGSASLAWPQLSSTELFRQSLLGSTARTDVETTILMAYAQISSPSLQTQDKLRFLHSIAQAYDTLHLPRKKAVILRQLALVSSTEVAQEENKPVEMDLATDAGDFRGATIVKSGSQASGAADVLDMLRRAYQIYALPNPFEEESLRASFVPPEELALVFERIFAHYGWLELQHALVKEAVRVCELLPDLAGAAGYTALALRRVLDAMSSQEQRTYIDDIKHLNESALKHGLNPAYWGPDYPLLSLDILSLPEVMRITEQTVRSGVSGDAVKQKVGFSDLVVHSVTRGQGGAGTANTMPTLVQGEPGEISILLSNPYSVPIQVDSIELISTGVECAKFPPISATLAPLSVQTLTLICIPLGDGDLVIKGCNIRLAGCAERACLLPLNAPARGEDILRAFAFDIMQHKKAKHATYERWCQTRKDLLDAYANEEDCTFLTCRVIPKQPLLVERGVSLTHGIAMLYEGESLTIQAEVENVSGVDIDFLNIALEDNVTSFQRQRIGSDDVSPQMRHDLELDMKHAPVLQVDDRLAQQEIGSKASLSLEIVSRGKPGLASGSLNIQYANLAAKATQAAREVFYTRSLQVPFAFSVQSCLRCQSWQVLRLSRYPKAARRQHRRNMSVTSVGRGLAIDEDLEDLLKNVNDEDSCLLVLEVENTSTRQAFEAVAMASDAIGAKVKERIEPNTTVNLLLPIKKIRLSEETVLQPIPLLSSRQFVVGKNMLQPYELSRFWYREELMRAIQLEWREVGSRRNGSCNLRHLPLTDEMFAAFKLSDLPLTVEVSQDGELCFQNEHEHWDVREGRFTDMAISLKNLKDRNVTMIAHLEVKPGNGLPMRSNAEIDPTSRNLLIDGTTTVALPTLKAKEKLPTPLLFSLCFMSKGMFMLDVLLEEMLDKDVTDASRIKARTQHTVCFNVS